ncbi:uncharacterized protein BKA55DRAFT_600065 [Fusarium redolens]|uniref:Major facilitator superfamily (MFS) profile domain-containing protein n=1 Tax=Fusarium redolens TaxID=48865 RepID=A0A9P9FX87_FUSRE|nr:uncharacterized protein BKA55DRAFT_600065 [Fusarium redolens]KAH7208456.1 hypothetical protein BKA55DRAFT_600065 [Fusarium redolens]
MSESGRISQTTGTITIYPGQTTRYLKLALDPADLDCSSNPQSILVTSFASVTGLLLGYEYGSINGIVRSRAFIDIVESSTILVLRDDYISLILPILFCGALLGSVAGGYGAESFGRRRTVIVGSAIYSVGVIVQMMVGVGSSDALGAFVAGRFIAGCGMGILTTGTILYMSESCHHKVRGGCIAGFQWCITIGYLAATIIVYAIDDYHEPAAYRILIGIQFLWSCLVVLEFYLMPESPRYLVHIDSLDEACRSLERLRGLSIDSPSLQVELSEVVLERQRPKPWIISFQQWVSRWVKALARSCSEPPVPRWFLGISMHMVHEWSGITFILLSTNRFLESSESIHNPLLITLILAIVNVCSTPLSLWTVDHFGRRYVLLVGTCGMIASHFIIAIVGVTVGIDEGRHESTGWMPNNSRAINAQIAMMAMFVFFYASSWGPTSWVIVGEIFHPMDRSHAVGYGIAGQWFFKLIITATSPYVTGKNHGHQQSCAFFLWGSLCVLSLGFAYIFVPEARCLTLEQSKFISYNIHSRQLLSKVFSYISMNQNRWITFKQQGDALTIHVTPLLAEILDCQNKKTTPTMLFVIGSVADMNMGEGVGSLQLPPLDEYGVTLHLCRGTELSSKRAQSQVILAHGPINPKRIGLDNHNSGESIGWLKGYQKPYPLASVYSRLLSHFFDVVCIMLSSFPSVEHLTEYLSVWILAHASTNSDPGVNILPRLVVVVDGEVEAAAKSENNIRPKSPKEIQHQIESGILDKTGVCLNRVFSELFIENLSSKGVMQRKRQCPTLRSILLNQCSVSRKLRLSYERRRV